MSYDPTLTVPTYFSRVPDQVFETEYLPDRQKVADHFGDLFVQNHFYGEPSLSHSQLSMWVGGLAMYAMSNTSYRFWSEEENVDNIEVWSQLMWRLIQVLPLGYAFARNSFGTANSSSWHPGLDSVNKGVKAKHSNRVFAGGNVSLPIFMRLFPEYFEPKAKAMMAFAIGDICSSSPNVDNPLYVALRTALRRSLHVHNYPIPYFWTEMFNAVLSPSPNDVMLLNAVSKYESVQNYTLHQVLAAKEAPELQPVHTKQAPEIASITPTLDQVTQPQVKEQSDDVYDFVASIAEVFVEQADQGTFIYNDKGAVCQYVNNTLHFVVPKAYKELLNLVEIPFTDEQLGSWLIDNRIVLPVMGIITSPTSGKVFQVNLAQISHEYAHLFMPKTISLVNNPTIQVES
jgi:hypothetical protein